MHRLRFGTGTRLCYFSLPLPPELDARSARVPVKVHRVFVRDGERWVEASGPAGGERALEDGEHPRA